MNTSKDETFEWKLQEVHACICIIILNSALYFYASIISGNPIQTSRETLLQYGKVNYLVPKGWYWQFFTATFVHVNLIHLLGNMFFLLIFDLRAEELFNVYEYPMIYLLSQLAGNLFTLLLALLLALTLP